MAPFLPELAAQRLVLWRLRRSSEEQLWCTVYDFCGELSLAVQDPSLSRAAVTEVHRQVGSLLERAEELRRQLLDVGWQSVDVDLDEPD